MSDYEVTVETVEQLLFKIATGSGAPGGPARVEAAKLLLERLDKKVPMNTDI